MKQLENMIINWHKDTFPNATNQAILDKLIEELEELRRELNTENPLFKYELADVVIVAISLLGRDGEYLSDYIKKKMKINKKREWGEEIANGDRPRQKNT